jgi:UDP-N-acetylglucosamine 2-epimerase (non-hydrolysing)
MKITSIVGARPNFIKLAPLSKELRKEFDEVIVHTGQHYDYDMNKIFFDELGIPEPDYHLGVGSGSHGYQTGEMLRRSEEVLVKEQPDLVLVFGDTNTTLAGALAATKLHISPYSKPFQGFRGCGRSPQCGVMGQSPIKVGHVEAGLRSFDKRMPEEINRVLTDHCSDFLFCPTETAVENLNKEGITKGVYLTGDVMVDALKENIKIAERKSKILEELGLNPMGYYLTTIHRAENTDDFNRLGEIAKAFCEIENLVFPCHPRTEKYLKEAGLWDTLAEHVKVIKPVGYLDMLLLYGRKIAQGYLSEDLILRVVYEESEREITVVTVYPSERRRYG